MREKRDIEKKKSTAGNKSSHQRHHASPQLEKDVVMIPTTQ
jgi:hypothetical protein